MRKPSMRSRQFLFEGFDELDQRQRVGVEVVDERLPLGDGRRLDLEDVGEPVTHDLEDLLVDRWDLVERRLCWHAEAVYCRAVWSGVGGDRGADLAHDVTLDHLGGHADAVHDGLCRRRSVAR